MERLNYVTRFVDCIECIEKVKKLYEGKHLNAVAYSGGHLSLLTDWSRPRALESSVSQLTKKERPPQRSFSSCQLVWPRIDK